MCVTIWSIRSANASCASDELLSRKPVRYIVNALPGSARSASPWWIASIAHRLGAEVGVDLALPRVACSPGGSTA